MELQLQPLLIIILRKNFHVIYAQDRSNNLEILRNMLKKFIKKLKTIFVIIVIWLFADLINLKNMFKKFTKKLKIINVKHVANAFHNQGYIDFKLKFFNFNEFKKFHLIFSFKWILNFFLISCIM